MEHIPASLNLERVTFHKSLVHQTGAGGGSHHHGQGKDNFSYVLMCEVGEALADLNHAREFVDTLKYRQCGVTSMYVITSPYPRSRPYLRPQSFPPSRPYPTP